MICTLSSAHLAADFKAYYLTERTEHATIAWTDCVFKTTCTSSSSPVCRQSESVSNGNGNTRIYGSPINTTTLLSVVLVTEKTAIPFYREPGEHLHYLSQYLSIKKGEY